MSPLDWLLLVIVGGSSLAGLMRGFVGVIASIGAWLLGGWTSMSFGGSVAEMLAGSVAPGPSDLLFGYGLCFAGVAIAISSLAWFVRRLLAGAGLGAFDRGLGLALGALRGGFVACVLVLLLGFTSLPRQPRWQDSMLVPVFVPGARWLASWLPDWAADRIDLDGRGAAPSTPALPELPPLPA
ncbi:CvpA family protein [Lysobacter humi (ex Lee et al. 2017)]